MDRQLAHYVVRFYGNLMSATERQAHAHLLSAMKITHGRSDREAQERARGSHLRLQTSDDPEVLRLAGGGLDEFEERVAARIIAEHADEIFLNYCPRCRLLAKTPKARQCRYCRFDWHSRS